MEEKLACNNGSCSGNVEVIFYSRLANYFCEYQQLHLTLKDTGGCESITFASKLCVAG